MRSTYSLCPECLKPISAQEIEHEGNIYLKKICKEHGEFSTVVWRGNPSLETWRKGYEALKSCPPCPDGCGLCSYHKQQTCCVILEITNNCNLDCNVCYNGGNIQSENPSLNTVKEWLNELSQGGKTFVQISGGEPTTREDLPEISSHAKNLGFKYIQLNSNGIKIAENPEFAQKLADAGLSFVFMQFDGTRDYIYKKLRGKPLLSQKICAINTLDSLNIGVALVMTVVPGINVDDIGNVINLGVSLSPAVRGVHFQPISYFGKYPKKPLDEDRITLPEVFNEIINQTNIDPSSISPSSCDHAMCGFHGDFVVTLNGLRSLSRKKSSNCCNNASIENNQNFIGRRWKRKKVSCCEGNSLDTFDGFLKNVSLKGFTITAMAFQDRLTVDLERISHCSLHVYKDKKLIPFCLNHM